MTQQNEDLTFIAIPERFQSLRAVKDILRLRERKPSLAKAIEANTCGYCRVRPGYLCRTVDYNIAYYHTSRIRRAEAQLAFNEATKPKVIGAR